MSRDSKNNHRSNSQFLGAEQEQSGNNAYTKYQKSLNAQSKPMTFAPAPVVAVSAQNSGILSDWELAQTKKNVKPKVESLEEISKLCGIMFEIISELSNRQKILIENDKKSKEKAETISKKLKKMSARNKKNKKLLKELSARVLTIKKSAKNNSNIESSTDDESSESEKEDDAEQSESEKEPTDVEDQSASESEVESSKKKSKRRNSNTLRSFYTPGKSDGDD